MLGSNATWYLQVAFVVTGHVAGLTLAHDRALAIYCDARQAVRSQYWMLVIMVGFTSLALWLLSQAMTPADSRRDVLSPTPATGSPRSPTSCRCSRSWSGWA